MLQNLIKASLLVTICLLFCTCSRNRMEVDIETVSIPQIKFLRLEKDMNSLTKDNVSQKTKEIKNNYGNFFERYISTFINPGGSGDSLYERNVLSFVNDKDIKSCNKEISATFTDAEIEKIFSECTNSIKRFHYFFPKRNLPKHVITCQSGWNYSNAYTDSTLAIGLDMYLGEKSVFYQMLNFQQYRTRCMNKNYLVSDQMQGWLVTEFDNDVPTNTLINHTIFYGKVFFALKALCPEVEDSVILHYTTKHMGYCDMYEKNVWSYMAEKNRLYENNMRTVQELTGEGPFTAAISKECPPGIAKWIGWQIVKSYMDKNEKVTLEELMKEKDAQKILSKSKYRP